MEGLKIGNKAATAQSMGLIDKITLPFFYIYIGYKITLSYANDGRSSCEDGN